jgi:hypothetical protein
MTVILATSDDDGLTWTDEAVDIDPHGDGPVRAFALSSGSNPALGPSRRASWPRRSPEPSNSESPHTTPHRSTLN